MSTTPSVERLINSFVTYTLKVDVRFVVIEHVPARVNEETRKRFFAPETVERIQQIVWDKPKPTRRIQTPVFEFDA